MINVLWDKVWSRSNEFIEKSNCSRKNCLNVYIEDLGSELLSCEIVLGSIITTLLVLRDIHVYSGLVFDNLWLP